MPPKTIVAELAIKREIVSVPDARGSGVTTEAAIIVPTGTNGPGAGEWRADLPWSSAGCAAPESCAARSATGAG